jgi:chromate reductase, NAD(P)H dehydrogenase (quinone)
MAREALNMSTILCLSGSLRAASSSRAVLEKLCGMIEDEVSIVRFDIATLPHYNADLESPETVEALKSAIANADGLIIVTPEYNYSVPGVLKNAIDWASRPAYASVLKGKPVFVVSTSGGAMGGVRAQAHMKYILNGVLARVFPWQEVIVPHANQKVKDGVFADEAIEAFMLDAAHNFLKWIEDRKRAGE